jgi:hypothetical protein
LLAGVSELLEAACHTVARSVNTILTTTDWEIGRRLVEFEQGSADRAAYGATLLKHPSQDLSVRFGRDFSEENLRLMRLFYLRYRERISQKVFGKSSALLSAISETVSGKFPLSWSHDVRLLTLDDPYKRKGYETA